MVHGRMTIPVKFRSSSLQNARRNRLIEHLTHIRRYPLCTSWLKCCLIESVDRDQSDRAGDELTGSGDLTEPPGAGGAPPRLEIEGEVRGRTEQAAAFLRHSPLAPRFAGILDTLDARGPSTLALRLELSLPAGPRRVSGRLEVRDNLVDLPGFAEGVRGMNGVFEFRGPAVSAEGVEARYLGRPILLDLGPVA